VRWLRSPPGTPSPSSSFPLDTPRWRVGYFASSLRHPPGRAEARASAAPAGFRAADRRTVARPAKADNYHPYHLTFYHLRQGGEDSRRTDADRTRIAALQSSLPPAETRQ
jgi:hypothetical protein